MTEINITSWDMSEPVKANGNPVDEWTFRLIDGHFYEGETVTVETLEDGKRYTRKVRNDSYDLYIVINNIKRYWSCDSMY